MHQRRLLLFVLLHMVLSLFRPEWASAEDPSQLLAIEIQDHGTAVIHATMELLTAPDQAFAILTDYEQWAALFPEGFHIHLTDCAEACTVVADMIIPHALVPWTTRLRVQSQESPPHLFELHLLDGDYLQYHLRWEFAPALDTKKTRATMSLTLQPKGSLTNWTPNFLYEWTLRNGLEDHFEKIRQHIAKHHTSTTHK
ncbi:SRPBCC family protein [Nitrospira sp. M1]